MKEEALQQMHRDMKNHETIYENYRPKNWIIQKKWMNS